ncbi:Z-ring-associated protein ZapA [Thioalkalivibrio nitratireducens DSM 14787]|uniref:Cell division protein ZapA n=1 Tax=Thioalkalivibrio nitratireducens (strain DSM 14787 / UNIQEM 213 / ALEN2) TaxID=1255043 RepID=L0DWJ1_THIND|nr:cell division protein ZapA [Thioalkalivibrio nitratireducens]AGA32741.1 Z-ring-associated protein ZapA [Thioalkalivibrio nitratireducens DSM 14787]
MNRPAEPVRVSILGKEYQVACPPEERADLYASASLLDERMRAVRDAGRVVGADRIAVMVALNLAHEMLQCRRDLERLETRTPERLKALAEAVEKRLGDTARNGTNGS